MIRRLLEGGFDVVACGAAGDGFEQRVRDLGCRFVAISLDKGGMNPFRDLLTFWQLMRLFQRERPRVVHCFTIKPVIYGIPAARVAAVPRRIATITGLGYAFSRPSGFMRRIAVFLYRISMRSAHHVFFQNPEDRATFEREVLPAGITHELVPGSGVDLAAFKPSAVEAGPTEPVVLLYGRMLYDKGVGEFVAAARMLQASGTKARFVLMGDPDPSNPKSVPMTALQAWKAEGVVDYLPAAVDVRPVLASADIVVLPSYHEGFPRSLLEAAAMGKALIATDIPGCRQIVDPGVNGFLVPPRKVDELAETIQRVLDNPAWRKQAGRASRQKVEAGFSEDFVVDRALASYSQPRR